MPAPVTRSEDSPLPRAAAGAAATLAWARAIAQASVLFLLALGTLLVIRRLAGAFTAVLPPAYLVATALAVAAITLGGRTAWLRTLPAAPSSRECALARLLGWTGSLALWLLAIGCSYPAARVVDWVAWLPLLLADQLLRQAFFDRLNPRAAKSSRAGPALRIAAESTSDALFDGPTSLDDAALQQITRVRDDDGVESIHGILRAEFAAGQRTATLHVGFCPPLSSVPAVDAETADGPEATTKVVQALCHGARLEVRLAEPAEEPCGVLVEFVATPSAPLPRRG